MNDFKPRTNITTKVIRYLGISFLGLVLFSCSSSTGPGATGENRVEGLDAELGSQTTFISKQVAEIGLIEADTENHTYTFDAEVLTGENVNLEPGQILLISGTALRRITSVGDSDGQVTVQTNGDVTLEEAFKEADIQWNESLQFTQAVAEKAVIEFQGEKLHPNKVSEGQVEWEYKVGAFTVKGKVVAEGAQAKVTVLMQKDYPEGGVAYKADATIQQINNSADIQIRNHETKSFRFENPGMSGKVDLTIAAAGGGVEPDLGFGPVTMFTFPFTIGPIPVVLSVHVQTVAKLTVHGKASATATSSISYNGDTGLTFDGTTYKGTIGGGIDFPIFGSGGGDSAPNGFDGYNVDTQYGFAAPVIELAMFGNTIVPYVRPEFYIGSQFHWAPICKNVHLRYGIKGGMDLRFLGRKLTNLAEIALVEEKREDHYSDRENCSTHYDMSKAGRNDLNREISFSNIYTQTEN